MDCMNCNPPVHDNNICTINILHGFHSRGGYGKAVDIWSIGCILGELSDGQPVFPGESEIDQLYVIQKVIGPLPPEQMHLFNSNPRFRGLKFPTEIKPLTLKQKYQHSLPADLVEFLEMTLRLEARKRLTIEQCGDHRAFEKFRIETKETENRNENCGTEESWKEIQFEDPCNGKKEESFVEPKVIGKPEEDHDLSEKSKKMEGKIDNTQKQIHVGKTMFSNRKENTQENGEAISNGVFTKPNQSMLEMKISSTENKSNENRTGKESLGNKGQNRRKTSNDSKLEMGMTSKQFGKYNKSSMNGFGKISANDMTWSLQQACYLNAGQRSFQPKNSFSQFQNQTQVRKTPFRKCFF